MTANHTRAEPRHHDAADETPARATGRAPALVFCLAAGLIYWTIVARGPVATGDLGFADAYMHLVRAAELLASGDWYDHEILRSNAPYGEILHWTRPFDVILLVLTALLRPFMAAREALYWAGALVSPLLTVATCLAAAWAIAPLAVRHRHWVMPLLFLQWPVLGYGYPGRADHHILILLVFVVGIGLLLRALARPADRHWPLLAGLSHGFGLWVAAEFLIALAVAGGFLTLRWLLERERGLVHMLGRLNQRFFAGLTLMTALGVALEHPLSRLAFPEYDRISSAHFAMALLATAL